MHLKYKRNLIQTTVSPTLGSASMLFKASSLAAVIFGFLIIGANADYLCKPEQIRWTATAGNKYKCLECPDCPARTQPSVPCGSLVPYGTAVHCIACELGKTYSDKYGKARCKPCTVCSKGKAVKKNCTLSSNTVCDSKCVEGHYLVPFIFTCFPCADCCNDEEDEKAKECRNYAKKCQVRSIPCANVPTKTRETTTDGRGPSTANSQKTSTASKTTQPRKLQNTMSTTLRTHDAKPPTLSVPSTASENDRQVVDGSVASESEEKNNVDTTLIIVAATCAVIAIVATLSTSKLIIIPAYKRRSNLDANAAAGIEMSQLKPSASHSQEQQKPVPILLSQLKSVALDAYERVWKRLDKIPEETNKGDFKDVAKDFGLPQEDIWELEKEFKVSGSGSPSRQLLECLETRRPQLTVSEFVEVLQKPNIDRDDIGDILKDYQYFQVNQGRQINP